VSQQINLFNPELSERQSALTLRNAGIVWAVAAAAVLAWAAIAWRTADSLAAEQVAVAAKLETAREDLKRLGSQAAMRKHDAQVAAELARLEAQVRDRHDVMEYLKGGELGDTRGFSEHFKAFARQSFEGLWLTGLHIAARGQDMTVEGRALKAEFVPGYLKRLNGESVMQGHPFADLVIQLPREVPGSKPTESDFVEFRIATQAADKAAGKRPPQ
jgi:hypothetical protein